jgi:predicted dehydrogenase
MDWRGVMEKIKIGQIGVCHEHASGKMKTLRLRPDLFEIVGVADDRASTAAKFAGSDLDPYEGLPLMSEDELFRIPGLEAVAVEVPNLDLVATASRCLDHNLPIHMDKPGGDDMAAFERLRRGYEDRNLPFQMGYMFRGNPAVKWIQNAVAKGWLGDIFEIQASMSHNYGGDAYQDYLGKFPGGIMFNLGCHLIDLVLPLLGRPTGVVPFLKSAPHQPEHIKNNCVSILEYPHASVTLRACSMEIDGLARRRLKICGTKGSIDLCPLERFDGKPLLMDLVLREDTAEYAAGSHTVDFGVVRDRYESELYDFARFIRGELTNPYTYEHDCLVEEVLLAASGYTKWK